MHDGTGYDQSDEWKRIIEVPLSLNEGIACFMVSKDDEDPVILYCSHRLRGSALDLAYHASPTVRATQAISIQRRAREEARRIGYTVSVE